MKKEALINIIINDLKDVQQLMEAFRGETLVNSAFVNLAKTKIRNIEEEISLLDQVFGDSTVRANLIEKKRPEEKQERKETVKHDNFEKKDTKSTIDEPAIEDTVIVEKKVSMIDTVQETATTTKSVKKKVDVKNENPIELDKKIESKRKSDSAKRQKLAGGSGILGDVLQKKKSAVNEKISMRGTENDLLYSKPVDDVRKAMGINDRFLYQRELFEGNADLFNQTLDQLNRMTSFDDANNFLISNFNWDQESEVSGLFLKIVKRRFL